MLENRRPMSHLRVVGDDLVSDEAQDRPDSPHEAGGRSGHSNPWPHGLTEVAQRPSAARKGSQSLASIGWNNFPFQALGS